MNIPQAGVLSERSELTQAGGIFIPLLDAANQTRHLQNAARHPLYLVV